MFYHCTGAAKRCSPLQELETHSSVLMGFIVSVLGLGKGYTVKYTRSAEGVPEGEAKAEGVYLTLYPESSPNTDSISNIRHKDFRLDSRSGHPHCILKRAGLESSGPNI